MGYPDYEKPAVTLAEFLTKKDSYGGKSPLLQLVEARIISMAGDIAQQVIDETPELHDQITRLARSLVAAALTDDIFLSRVVTDAIAKGLAQYVRERGDNV